MESGKASPLGASLVEGGVNFSLFSRHAGAVSLLLFEGADPSGKNRESKYQELGCQELGCQELALDPWKNKTGDIWHCFIPGLKAGACYLYRVDGPYEPEKGLRFNANKLLLDPYAKALTDLSSWDTRACAGYDINDPSNDLSFSSTGSNVANQPRCIVVDDHFDWQGDRPLNYPLRFSVLYETHVRGLSKAGREGIQHPGTYRGVIESIPYLKDLGITSLELLPIQEFNEKELFAKNPKTGEQLVNYWGYSTVAFFAPKGTYAADPSPGAQVHEFKEMVRELHKAGIEVILDIVFNHTAEGSELGPTISFRGLDNPIYYLLDENRRYYRNYSGCGNTLNCNHPVVRNFVIDCLLYWVMEMHIDGFRFDLGSILGRDQKGRLMENPPMLEMIAEEPVLSSTKIIAEAWDAGGAYQVGWFPGGRWAEWNDRFRDDVRCYWRGDSGETRHLATRLSGSSDLYLRDGRKPFHSINFITSHDGFTLHDLVSYNLKHNENNGEKNRDGSDNNNSYNYGVEGPTNNPNVLKIREQQIKNFIATLMVSIGTPMLLGGDEIARTQNGNNNAYCQDNQTSWYDWGRLEKHRGLYRFAKEMIAFRRRHPGFMRPEFYTGRGGSYNAIPDICWFTEKGEAPKWENLGPCLAMRIDGSRAEILADKDDNDFFIMFNSSMDAVHFSLAEAPAKSIWMRAVDTSFASPQDILPPGEEEPLDSLFGYAVMPRSMVILISKDIKGT